MNQQVSTNSGSAAPSTQALDSAQFRQVERKLDYSISRFGIAMDHLATKVNGTAQFIDKVGDVFEIPKRGYRELKANPDPYVRKTLIIVAAIAAIKVFRRDFEFVSPLSR